MKLAAGICDISKTLCSLQEMDQHLKDWLVVQQYKFFLSLKGQKIIFQMGCCLFNTKHVGLMIIITDLSCFFNFK